MFFKGLVDGRNGFSWMDWIRFFFGLKLDLGLDTLAFQDIETLGFSVIPDFVVFRRLVPQRNGFKSLLLNFGD